MVRSVVILILGLLVPAVSATPPVRFVDAAEAADAIERAHVLDTRSFGEYLKGHLPGAVHMNDESLRGPRGGLPVQYWNAERLAGIFGDAGITLESPVIVYSSIDDPLAATMTAYALSRIGHADVRIISGGFEAWAANRSTTRAFPAVEPTIITPGPPTIATVTYPEFADSVGFDDFTFIDARPKGQYLGDLPIWTRNGHIPGAFSLDWTQLTDPHNKHRLRPRSEIEAMLRDLGVSDRDEVIVYCGTGREATLMTIAIACELGWPNVRMYEGSWTEYSSIEGTQVHVGPRVDPKTRVHRDGDLFISAQPTERTLEWLAGEGVRTVISLRTESEHRRVDFDESEIVETLGLRFVQIPMGGEYEYTPDQLSRFVEAYRTGASEGNVLVHCASGGRARLLWTAYLINERGMDPNEAMDRASRLGGEPWSLGQLLGGGLRATVQR